MLDIKYIRDNPDKIKKAVELKKLDLNVDELLDVDSKRRDLIAELEGLQNTKNEFSKIIGGLAPEERQVKLLEMKEVDSRATQTKAELEKVLEQYFVLMAKVPTVPAEDTPIGRDDRDNVEVDKWGAIPQFDFPIKDHIQLGKDLDILDLERGAKVGGYRGYYVKNDGVLLMMGFLFYALQKMAAKGYAPMIPPTLIKESALFGSGYFKGREYNPDTDEIYMVNNPEAGGEKKFLVGTAEPSLLAYYSDEVLDQSQLPMRLSGFSQCYRSEIGSYGKDTKGIYRVHEFMKIEQVVLAPADVEVANKMQEEMLSISQELHRDLGLPYRVLRICSGDLGTGKYKQFDMEAWIPSRNGYGETGSSSNFLDWQSRRLNVKYKTAEGKKEFVYMLNNTALPSPRIFIAILENYQQKDGSIKVPEVLVPFVGKTVIK
jgi:seryl-tRNA synthetase